MDRPTPEEYQPPLSAWGHAWRYALCLALSALVWGETVVDQWREHRPWFWVAAGLGVVAYAAVGYRRRHPLLVAVGVNALSILSGPASGPASLAIVSVATRRRYRDIAVTAAVSLVTGILHYELPMSENGDPLWVDLTSSVVATAALLGWGMFIGSRRELIWTLRNRAERAEAEQGLRVAQARSQERARIAREMHDVLAHRISQIALHAGAIGFREDLTAEQMRDSAGLIQEKAHEALQDLRGVLGVLRDAAGEPSNTPQPTYRDLVGLVEGARSSGLHVELADEVEEPERVPTGVGRAVYRIVQEGITNAHKHAPGARLSIRLAGRPGEGVTLDLRNPLGFGTATPGAGLGLVGLGERAALAGGRLEHRVDHGTFVLHGWLPWPP